MINILVLQVFLYLTCTYSYTGFQEVPLDDPQRSNPIDANQLVKWNARYSADIFWAMKVGHIGACAVMCIRMTICASFNFYLDSHMCEMNSNIRDYQTDLLLWKQNSVYSKIQDWPNELDPHCHHRPCARDEVCLPSEVASLLNGNFKVQCLKNHASQTPRSEPTLTISTSTSTTTTTSTPTSTTTKTSTPTSTSMTSTPTSTSTTSTPTSTSTTSTSTSTTSTTSTSTSTTSTTSLSSSTTSTSTMSTTSTTSASYADCLAGIEGYSGNIAETNNGQSCQYWSARSPHTHSYTDADFPLDGSLADANNYCREVAATARPWCFTTNPEILWGYCTFKICQVVTSPCGGTLTGASGSITTPPTPGTANFDCVWFVRAANNHTIQYQVEVLKSNDFSECGEFMPLSIIYSSTRVFPCGNEYHYEHRVTSSDTLMVYYYTDEHVQPLDFTLYYRTKGVVVANNIALGKTVTMSSLYTSTQHGDGVWAYAVDGNTSKDWYNGGCACTNNEADPWLLVDLGGTFTVTSLKIFNREDGGTAVSDRLGDLSIQFGSTTTPPEIATYSGAFPLEDTIQFDMPYTGRYLRISMNKTEYLSICELELYEFVSITNTHTETCFPLRSPENGNVDVLDTTPVGHTASYTCNDCFMLHGSEQRTCRLSGVWDGTQPSCVATPTYDNSCYYFFMTNITWWDAVETCEDLHGNAYLLELESEEENNFVVNTLNSMEGALSNDWWIGLSNINGGFQWESETTGLPYYNWLPGSGTPNDNPEEDKCVILYHEEGFKWVERDCEDKFYFICELDMP